MWPLPTPPPPPTPIPVPIAETRGDLSNSRPSRFAAPAALSHLFLPVPRRRLPSPSISTVRVWSLLAGPFPFPLYRDTLGREPHTLILPRTRTRLSAVSSAPTRDECLDNIKLLSKEKERGNSSHGLPADALSGPK